MISWSFWSISVGLWIVALCFIFIIFLIENLVDLQICWFMFVGLRIVADQFFFFFLIILLIFFFFLCVDAPWRGVALAQGLAGLTPGPALHKIDSCFYLCHKIQDLIGNWMIPNLRFLRKSMILHNLLLDYHRVPSPYKDNIKTGDEIQDYISLIQPVVKVVVVGI